MVAVCTALAVGFTWPLIERMSDSIPSDPGDPLLNAWILGWDAERLRHGLAGWWDAPNFFPYHHTLAFSEHLLGIAVFVAPIVWTTGNPLIAYNAAFILSFALAAVGMFLLARELTGRSDAAWIAALIFGFTPARLGHIGHLQVLMCGWMPLSLWALHRYVRTRSIRTLAAFASFVIIQGFSNNYYIYFLALPVGAVAVHAAFHTETDRAGLITRMAAAGAVIVAAFAPVALIYADVRRVFGFRRTLDDVTNFGADLGAYLNGNAAIRHPLALWRFLPSVSKPVGSEGELFIGLAATLLAAIGVAMAFRQWRDASLTSARVYSFVLLIGLILSLGAQPAAWRVPLPIGGLYRALFAVLPGFDGLRVAARLSFVVDLAAAVLAACAVARLSPASQPAMRRMFAGSCAVIIVLESYGAPIPLAFVGRGGHDNRAAYNWVRDHGDGSVLELPAGEFAPPLQSYRYEYETFFHHRPIVNGASGYDSPLHVLLGSLASPLLEAPLLDEALRLLRALDVRTIVLHPEDYVDPDRGAEAVAALTANPIVRSHAAFGAVSVFTLAPFDDTERPDLAPGREPAAVKDDAVREIPPARFSASASHATDRLPFAFDHDLDTRWLTGERQNGSEWVELTLDRPVDVARLRFLTSSRSVGDYPRSLIVEALSDDGRAASSLFAGPVVFQLGMGFVRDPQRGPIDVWLRPNHTRRIRLRQTGTTRRWFWSIDELSVWESVK
jgi:hypothetical protein